MNTIKSVNGMVLQACFDFIYMRIGEQEEIYEKKKVFFYEWRETAHAGALLYLYLIE
jgi:hypothetical protein